MVEDGVNGLLIPPRSPEALREAISTLLGDPSLQERFRQAGIARMARFDREATFASVEATLESAAGIPSPAVEGS